MKTDPFISVLVLNWNGQRYIDSFFASIEKQSYGTDNIEVLFIDNDSHDNSVEHFLAKKIPYARLVQTGANLGYAGGNDVGFHQAKGDYVVVCNNDLEFDHNWLKNLVVSAIETDADVTVPKLIYARSDRINNAGSNIVKTSDWPIIERGIDQPLSEGFDERVEVTAFCGASPMFKRSFLRSIGLFDRQFFLYWEDGDLSWRGQKAGKKYIFEPSSIAYHDASGSTGGPSSPVFNHYVSRNRVLILIKNGPLTVALRAFVKVGRDHVLFKLNDLRKAIRSGQGRKPALAALWRGCKILLDVVRLTPVMLLKRWHIMKEEYL